MVHFYAIKNAFDGQTHLDKEENMSVHGIEKSRAWAGFGQSLIWQLPG